MGWASTSGLIHPDNISRGLCDPGCAVNLPRHRGTTAEIYPPSSLQKTRVEQATTHKHKPTNWHLGTINNAILSLLILFTDEKKCLHHLSLCCVWLDTLVLGSATQYTSNWVLNVSLSSAQCHAAAVAMWPIVLYVEQDTRTQQLPYTDWNTVLVLARLNHTEVFRTTHKGPHTYHNVKIMERLNQ